MNEKASTARELARKWMRVFHTVRYLEPAQAFDQVSVRWRRRFERARVDVGPGSVDPGCRWSPAVDFLPPLQVWDANELQTGRFRFLNEERTLGWPPDWNVPGAGRLWQINVHYFEYLWSFPFSIAATLARDWMERHPLRRGAAGWEPYPTSLRLGNWCAYFFSRHAEQTHRDRDLGRALWASIQQQAEWLSRHLETHLMGNHLFENAAALAFCGACFTGTAADAWLERGRSILERELMRQIPADGMHVERSPMYHVRVTTLLAWLYNTGHAGLRALVSGAVERALLALEKVTHPDGEIALLNDSAFGIYNRPHEVFAFARRAGLRGGAQPAPRASAVFELPDAGYYGATTAEGHYLVCDAGEIGPDYQPGHAHGDTFSFELSFGGERVIRDAGVFDYREGEMRAYCRSTRAHNTVEIEGADQSELWSAFRVGRRARPRDVRFARKANGFRLTGHHDGYQRLRGRPDHARTVRWCHDGTLVASDRVTSRKPVEAISRLHVHPGCDIVSMSESAATLRTPKGQRIEVRPFGARMRREPSWYCPEFGRRIEGEALAAVARGSRVEFGWAITAGPRAARLAEVFSELGLPQGSEPPLREGGTVP